MMDTVQTAFAVLDTTLGNQWRAEDRSWRSEDREWRHEDREWRNEEREWKAQEKRLRDISYR